MDHELQNEINRTRHILNMKRLIKLVKSKESFDAQLNKMAKMQRLRMRLR